MRRERVLETLLVDGTFTGPRILHDPNAGTFSVASSLEDYEKMKSGTDVFPFDHPGVYVLLMGPNEDGLEKIYVGKATRELRGRIRDEVKGDEVRQVIAFSGTHLNGTHAEFLEAELIRRGKAAKTHDLSKNKVEPTLPPLTSNQRVVAESFLEDAILYFANLGIRAFEPGPRGDWMSPMLVLDWDVKASPVPVHARGRMEKDGGIWVFSGAVLVPDGAVQDYGDPTKYGYLKELRNQMRRADVLEQRSDGSYILTQDWRFESSSTAGSVLAGQQCNGWLKWKVIEEGPDKGKTLDELLRP